MAIVPGNGDLAAGPVRYSFLVVRRDARVVAQPRARVWVARSRRAQPFQQATAVLQPVGIPGVSPPAEANVTSIYVVHLNAAAPGTYWLVAEPLAESGFRRSGRST
ncbi:MAG: hypothetical protein M3R70_13545 [Actinomycetota bacterium]|nr:hypothetical protein [Actinomycetota bacterium]